MHDPETAARIAELKPGVHYRFGTRRPYRACPPDFREMFLRLGWEKAIEEHYRANSACIKRWIDECGGEDLLSARSRISGMPPVPSRRTRQLTYVQAVEAIVSGADLATLEALKGRRR